MPSENNDVISMKNRASVMLQNGQTGAALNLLEEIVAIPELMRFSLYTSPG